MTSKAVQQQVSPQNVHMPGELASMMKKQGYHFVGSHSATKICAYTASSLKGEGTCYKHRFYGIRSWRCIQATPAIGCNLACTFCWRIIPEEEGFKWNEINALKEWDDPEMIVEGLVKEHRRIISGYKGNEKVNPKIWEQANDPAHVALSLTGEPLFYPKMNELIAAFHKRKISTFLVTNGTMVNALKSLTTLPTQLYVSVQAPNKEAYERITRPKTIGAWDSFMKFLEVFCSLPTRRVFRLTLIRDENMVDAKGYADLIKRGRPHYVEVKGFVFVGGARNEKRNLSYTKMPSMEEVKAFANEIAKEAGYLVTDYHESSNIVLLCSDEQAAKSRIIRFEK
ncbi:MAG: 4-demethylwyosine synthase TYW1 [Candidatus Micrarchaeota archaeon]|nr:4-demethylwyosine synthase TYW1 [Candidatus Micrarchaeota archaeon]MDE1834164.1 4-demethylwyosine synthase TYW1 [Candidatus Micrarchaeota archaeon]MDE1858998.1 4-demethylwyosine synthase TYW1 [Candidatus Micrarchaeota archaeon]